MKTVKDLIAEYPTVYQASKATRVHATQLTRWAKMGAVIIDGVVYIPKGTIQAP